MLRFNSNGKEYLVEEMINGKMNGLVQVFMNGIKTSEFYMKHGIVDGEFVQYNLNSEKEISGRFIEGKKDGMFQIHSDIIHFINDIPAGEVYTQMGDKEYLFDVKNGRTNTGFFNRIYLYFKLKYLNIKNYFTKN